MAASEGTSAGAARRGEYLSVRLGGQEFALDVRAIREIRGWTAATALPHAPGFITGMINLRGTVLLVIDLAARLGLPSHVPDSACVVVVVEAGSRVAGLLVDAVCDIITVTDDMRQATPDTGTAASGRFVEGLIMMDHRIITSVSIPAVMPDDETAANALAA
jgi:purine-binding chemotaxis protein CheW